MWQVLKNLFIEGAEQSAKHIKGSGFKQNLLKYGIPLGFTGWDIGRNLGEANSRTDVNPYVARTQANLNMLSSTIGNAFGMIPMGGMVSSLLIGGGFALGLNALAESVGEFTEKATNYGLNINKFKYAPVVENNRTQRAINKAVTKMGNYSDHYGSVFNNRAFMMHKRFGV